jgi:ketosteroid isomerase-like protein
VLHELNENYVRAFREADVAWYDAHLAPSYLAIVADGSLHDRASALARFAQPTFATAMKRFPVGAVNVRRLGDTALIHAENAYELNDGRCGVSRYTDIWHRGPPTGGRWMCVAAHITTLQDPALPGSPASAAPS